MRDSRSGSDSTWILIATALTGVLLLWASFHPTSRVWGVSVWAYLDAWQRVVLFGLTVLVTAAILWRRSSTPRQTDSPRGPSAWIILVVAASTGVLYFLFRTQVHFLGDGYFLLNSLASDNPLLRTRNFGEMLIHRWIKDILPLRPEAAALASFRIVSIGAGVLHAALVAWLAPLMIGDRRHRWLFAACMMTGGYALLHFGYVENYSLFGLAVAVYVYLGVLISMGRVGKWWILPALAAAVFFHALGLTLVLPALYLLCLDTDVSKRLSRLGRTGKVLAAILVLAALTALAYWALNKFMFLRLTLVPLGDDFRVLEGYSMFSLPHLADFANLLLILIPGSLVFVAALMKSDWSRLVGDPRIRFLGVVSVTVLAAAFALEAKLGMPRDWDLFSFLGYPCMALLLLAVTTALDAKRAGRVIQAALVVGLVCLVPRILTARIAERGVQQFRDYAEIDIRKNRSGWYVLAKYFAEQADSSAHASVETVRARRFPEEAIARLADSAYLHGFVDSAMWLDRVAIRMNPTFSSGWTNLGVCYTYKNRHDSAIQALHISNALNPDAPLPLSHLGLAYFFDGRYEEAKKAFLGAHRLDSSLFEPVMALARLYQKTGDHEQYVHWLNKAVFRKEAEGIWASELGDEYLKQRDLGNAGRAFQEALDKGSDSLKILQRLEAHPELKFYMGR